MAEKGVLLRGRHAGWSSLEVERRATKAGGSGLSKTKGCLETAGPLDSLCQHSPVTVLFNAIATPLASLPVACVPEELRGRWGTVKDTKSMPQAILEIPLVHFASAVPGEIHRQLGSASRSPVQRFRPLIHFPQRPKVTYSQMP